MAVAVGSLVFGERVTGAKILGVLLGVAGVAVLTGAAPLSAPVQAAGGITACLLATACYALAGFLTTRWIAQRGGLDSRLVALGSQAGAMLLLLPFAAWQLAQEPIALQRVPAGVWWSLLA
ncbi:hypothetical protein ACSNOK_33465, partial [Streptomyces sp. URMC 126]